MGPNIVLGLREDFVPLFLRITEPLFGQVSFQTFQDAAKQNGALQGEFWRVFLLGMLLFLFVEAVLILPPRKPGTQRPFAQSVAASSAGSLAEQSH